MEKIHCSIYKKHAVKNGFQSGKQRYKCTLCNKKFILNFSYQAYKENSNNLIISLLKEGCGIRSISRILSISNKTVLSRLIKISQHIKAPQFNSKGCKFEMDEIWSFVGNKSNLNWITYAIEQNSKVVIGFIVGAKTKENIQPLVDKLLLLNPNRIYTDKLNIYPSLIPENIHKRFQYCTNKIERNNLTLRTHVKRLNRKTICFTKNIRYLEAHLRIYFGHNFYKKAQILYIFTTRSYK